MSSPYISSLLPPPQYSIQPSFPSLSHCLLLLICFNLISFWYYLFSLSTPLLPPILRSFSSWTTRTTFGFTSHLAHVLSCRCGDIKLSLMFWENSEIVSAVIGNFSILLQDSDWSVFSSLFLWPPKTIYLSVSNSRCHCLSSLLYSPGYNKLSTTCFLHLLSHPFTFYCIVNVFWDRKHFLPSIYRKEEYVRSHRSHHILETKPWHASDCYWAALPKPRFKLDRTYVEKLKMATWTQTKLKKDKLEIFCWTFKGDWLNSKITSLHLYFWPSGSRTE